MPRVERRGGLNGIRSSNIILFASGGSIFLVGRPVQRGLKSLLSPLCPKDERIFACGCCHYWSPIESHLCAQRSLTHTLGTLCARWYRTRLLFPIETLGDHIVADKIKRQKHIHVVLINQSAGGEGKNKNCANCRQQKNAVVVCGKWDQYVSIHFRLAFHWASEELERPRYV